MKTASGPLPTLIVFETDDGLGMAKLPESTATCEIKSHVKI
jgi:hypothetical protein